MKSVAVRVFPLVALVATVALAGCSAQEPPQVSPARDAGAAPGPTAARVNPNTEPSGAGAWTDASPGGEIVSLDQLLPDGRLQTVYFDYDVAEIRPDQRAKLQANAQFLREYGRFRVLIGGHADDRGTREYNQALGERRASVTMQYLVSLGVPRERIDIISYGEEMPAVTGSSESSWAQNRRAEFKVLEN